MKKVISILLILFLNIGFLVNSVEALDNSCKIIEGEKYDDISDFTYSPDGRSFAYVAEKDGKSILIKDGKEGKEYDVIFRGSLEYSSDGKSFSYAIKKDGEKLLVKDGEKLGKGYNFQYSPDGKSFAYGIKKDGKYFLIKDGKKLGEYDSIYRFGYSHDSKSFAYEVIEKGGNYFIVKDGIKIGKGGGFQYSPDSKGFSYIYRNENWETVIVKDGKELLGGYKFRYSPDGKSFAYLKEKDGKHIMFKDEEELGEVGLLAQFKYSPDSKSFAYEVEKEGSSFIIKDGIKIGEEYDSILDLMYSSDSKSLTYIASKDGKYVYIKDGKELGEGYDKVSEFKYSPDGKSFSYLARKGWESILIKDGKELLGGNYFRYSPDGKSFSYSVYKDGKNFVIKDGKELGQGYSFMYSPDGKSFTYGIKKDEKVFIIRHECSSKQKTKIQDFKITRTKLHLLKQVIISKQNLKKTRKGKKYVDQVDLVAKKLSKSKLESIYKKIDSFSKKARANKKYKDVLDYMEAKFGLVLLNSSIPKNTVQVVDATTVGYNLKGLEFSDKNKNIITTYISDDFPDDSVKIVDGINLGKPNGYKIITNEFIEISYPNLIKEEKQVIRVIPNEYFNTVMIYDSNERMMSRTPYSKYDNGQIQFKAIPVNGKITFSLMNITE